MSIVRRVAGWFDARRRVVALAAVAWVAVVVLAAGDEPATERWVGVPDLRAVVTVALALVLVAALILRLLLASPARQRRLPGRTKRGLGGLWLAAALAVLFAFLVDPQPPDELPVQQQSEQAVVPMRADDDPAGSSEETDRVGLGELAVLAGASALAVAVFVWSRDRSSAEDRVDGDTGALLDDLAPALDRAVEELLASSDPRTAILAAYAILEDVLARHDHARGRAETPAEHLERALRSLPVPAAPLAELGNLYEQARYSAHRLTSDGRRRALTILGRAREALEPGVGAAQ